MNKTFGTETFGNQTLTTLNNFLRATQDEIFNLLANSRADGLSLQDAALLQRHMIVIENATRKGLMEIARIAEKTPLDPRRI